MAWRDRSFARLNMVKLGELVLALDEEGSLGLVSLFPEGLTVHSRMQLPPGKAGIGPVGCRRSPLRSD